MRKHHSIPATIFSLLLALLVAGCGDDKKTNPDGNGGGADVTIQIVANDGANSYSPSPATVSVGQKVAWHNADSMSHTATADGGSFNTGTISPGGTSSPITMSAAGSFGYHCSLHSSMVATLQVNP